MKNKILLIITFFCCAVSKAQNFTGQWKGTFTDKSSSFSGWGGDKCDYVLELEVSNNVVSGYSYTYFFDGGKKYFTICRLTGKVNTKSKYVEVTEVERTKTNVPLNINNCFQVHKLTYFKKGTELSLEGSWVPAPNQSGDCGYGVTALSKRELITSLPNFNKSTVRADKPKKTIASKPKTTAPITTKVVPKPKINNTVTTTITPNATNPSLKKNVITKEETKKTSPTVSTGKIITPATPNVNFAKRETTVLKTIEIENETFKVDLYDNGEVDGDSISLFFNNKLLLSHKKLDTKPISLTLNVDEKKGVNELVMYAENLGEIAPNTALMVVTDGPHRYEVRIASDLQKSGVIRFIHKPK
jgi:hypothetical protein